MRLVLLAGVALASVAPKVMAQSKEPIDDPVIARIKDEGMHRSLGGSVGSGFRRTRPSVRSSGSGSA